MPQASHKITEFPGPGDEQEPVAPLPQNLITQDRDPTREIRDLIEKMQAAASDARRRQRQAEEEREQLRGKVLSLQEQLESGAPVKALARERDMLLEQQSQYGPQISDLKHRLRSAESDLHEAIAERDAALRESKQSRRLAEESDQKREESQRQRDAAIRQRDLSKQERDAAVEKAALATKNFADAQKALAEARQALTSTKKKGDGEPGEQLAALRQARDGMATQIMGLKKRIGELEDEAAEATYARETAEKRCQDLREDSHNAPSALDEARASLVAAQKQIDAIIRDRDAIKEQLSANTIALEAQLDERSAEVARLRQALTENNDRLTDRGQMEVHFEKRRLDMIDLSAQLENAHRDIRNLSASLAEARLQAKLAGRPVPSAGASFENRPGPVQEAGPGRDEIMAMRRCYQTFSRDQKQIGILGELETYALKISELALENGRPILHRASTAFASLLGDLLEVPDQITQASLRTLHQTIEFISLLLSDPGIEDCVKLGETRVYVVDDDQNTCAMVVEALKLVGLHSNFALYSSAAVAELAANSYDLIILDVHLPELNGFELCSHIRTMSLHAETPIFFVTGDTSLENRVKSSLRGGNEFISKPFIVQEIALKALKSVITGQLRKR